MWQTAAHIPKKISMHHLIVTDTHAGILELKALKTQPPSYFWCEPLSCLYCQGRFHSVEQVPCTKWLSNKVDVPPDTPTNQLEDQAEGTATSLRYVGSICRSISSFMTDETNPFVPSSVVFALPCTCPHRHNAIINIAFLIINFNLSIILSFNVFYSFPL